MYRAVHFARMIIVTIVASQNGCTKVPPIHPDQILRELVPPHNVEHLKHRWVVRVHDPPKISVTGPIVFRANWIGRHLSESDICPKAELGISDRCRCRTGVVFGDICPNFGSYCNLGSHSHFTSSQVIS